MNLLSVAAGVVIDHTSDVSAEQNNRRLVDATPDTSSSHVFHDNDGQESIQARGIQKPRGAQNHFLRLNPVHHPQAPFGCTQSKDNNEERLDQWRPLVWRPNAVECTDFYRGPACFQHQSIGQNQSRIPSLLLNWDLFKSMYSVAKCARTLQETNAWGDQQFANMAPQKRDLKIQQKYHEYELSELYGDLGSGSPSKGFEEVEREHQEALIPIRHALQGLKNNKEHVHSARQARLKDLQEAQDRLSTRLQRLYDDLQAPSRDEDTEVPITCICQEGKDDSLKDWAENNWNNEYEDYCGPGGQPSQRGSDTVEAKNEAGRPPAREDPEATWNNVFDDYPQLKSNPRQLHNACQTSCSSNSTKIDRLCSSNSIVWKTCVEDMSENFGFSYSGTISNGLPPSQAEALFGPVWLSRLQEATRRVIEAEEQYYDTERLVLDRKRAIHTARDKQADTEHGDNEAQLAPVALADAVKRFGDILPPGKRKHIDDWVDTATVSNKRWRAISSERARSALEISELADNVSNWEYGQGLQRRKIDDYTEQTQQVRQQTMAPPMERESLEERDDDRPEDERSETTVSSGPRVDDLLYSMLS